MNILNHLRSRFVDTPIAIDQAKFEIIVGAIGERIDLQIKSAEELQELVALTNYSKPASRDREYRVTDDGIACIPVQGTLLKKASGMMAMSGCMGYQRISNMLSECQADRDVRGILLDIDSPGGETHGCFELTDLIYSMRGTKPIYASANDSALSAAYAIASAADRVFITQTGAVGSIGVYSLHVDQSGADAKAGLNFTYIKAGKKKIDANPHEALSKSAKSNIQSEVDRQYAMFVDAVARNRSVSAEQIQETEAGIYRAELALEANLADEVGTFDDALAALTMKVTGMPATRSIRANAASAAILIKGETTMPAENTEQTPPVAAAAATAAKVDDLENKDKEKKDAAVPGCDDEEELKKAKAAAAALAAAAVSPAAKAQAIAIDRKYKLAQAQALIAELEASQPLPQPAAAAPAATAPVETTPTNKGEKKMDETTQTSAQELKRIVSSCTLAGHPELAAKFLEDNLTLDQANAALHKLRLDEQTAQKNNVDSNFGIPKGKGGSNPLEEMNTLARALALNSGGKLTFVQAFNQVCFVDRKDLYVAYEDQREAASHSRSGRAEYMRTVMPTFAAMGLNAGGMNQVTGSGELPSRSITGQI